MANPFTDKMRMGDLGVKIGLYCAKCNGKVITDQPHECVQIESTLEKESENEKTTN